MDYDIVIAGAGLAGSSMLRQLLQQPNLRDKNILVADRSLEVRDDRTWCFWTAADAFTEDLVAHRWPVVELGFADRVDTYALRALHYQCVRSGTYLNACRGMAEGIPNVAFLEADIQGFDHDGSHAVTQTSKGEIRSSIVFQSCLQPKPEPSRRKPIRLRQHFLGWDIETDRDAFEPGRARIMDFRTPQDHGFAFVYVLPFSPRHALVEYTLFSDHLLDPPVYEERLQRYITEMSRIPLGSFRIARAEQGVIPMEDALYPAWWCKGVANMGQAAGQSKASTGYTFSRVLRHTEALALAMVTGDWRHLQPGSKFRFRAYDRLILWMLRERPGQVIQVFRDLFHKNDTDRLLRFLDEQTRFTEEFNLFTTTKWRWFFEAILRAR